MKKNLKLGRGAVVMSAFMVTSSTEAMAAATSLHGIFANAGTLFADIGWLAIGFAGLVGLVLLVGGFMKLNKIFKSEGGSQESATGPAVALLIGILLMSVVGLKTAATTTMFGTDSGTQFNQIGATAGQRSSAGGTGGFQ